MTFMLSKIYGVTIVLALRRLYPISIARSLFCFFAGEESERAFSKSLDCEPELPLATPPPYIRFPQGVRVLFDMNRGLVVLGGLGFVWPSQMQ
jgi:hypothetical protein